MNQADYRAQNPYASFGMTAADAAPSDRVAFLKRTYIHLAMAVYALVGLEFIYFQIPGIDDLMMTLFQSRWGWLLVLGGFMLIGNIAERMAQSRSSLQTQYAGLGLYVVGQSVVLLPLLWIANHYATNLGGTLVNPILVAAGLTVALFSALTAAVLLTKKDFSFLGPALSIAGFVALGLIVLSIFGVMNLGVLFMAAMVVVASGYTLYYTSNVLHHYDTSQHVVAALALFSAVALLFWYILQIVLRFSSRD